VKVLNHFKVLPLRLEAETARPDNSSYLVETDSLGSFDGNMGGSSGGGKLPAATERDGNTLKRCFQDVCLKMAQVKAKIWPSMSYLCQTHSTTAKQMLTTDHWIHQRGFAVIA